MKKIFTLLAAGLITSTIWAQSPQKMSYQAVIRDAGGTIVTNQVGMRISILQGTSPGTAVYVETQTPTPNINGLVTIEIGGGNPTAFSAIDWSAGPYFIKTETDPTGPTATYTITGTSQLLSVPYALYAKTAETAVSGTGNLIHYIGELYGGGIVVAVGKVAGVEHGLIASLTDVASLVLWSDMSGLIGAAAQSPIDGQANTNAILLQSPTAPPALACADYSITVGGVKYDDWYLPAIWELNQCYNAAFIVNSILGPTNGFQFISYWSSTETAGGGANAWFQLFDTGYSNYGLKLGDGGLHPNLYSVRAVRKF